MGIWSDIPEGTILGDNVKIGRLCHIDKEVVIGDNTNIQGGVYICPHVSIAEDVFVGPCVVFTNDRYPPSTKLVRTHVSRGAVLCANSTIGPGVIIGEYAVVAMGAVVTHNVKPNTVVAGNPARFMQTRNEYNVKQLGYEND